MNTSESLSFRVAKLPALLIVAAFLCPAIAPCLFGEVWTTNRVLGPNIEPFKFAGIYEFDSLTIGDNVEVTSSNISQLVIKVNGTLTLGKGAAIRVRNGFYADAPTNALDLFTIDNVNLLGIDLGGVRVYPDTFGRGGNGGNGGKGTIHYIPEGMPVPMITESEGGGGGGGGGFGGGLGGKGAEMNAGNPMDTLAYGQGGSSNGGQGGSGGAGYTYYNDIPAPGHTCPRGAGGSGGGGFNLGASGSRPGETCSPQGGCGGGGGNGGAGVSGPFDPSHPPPSGYGYGGGGGGYGGGVLTIIADSILYDVQNPPHFLVSGQKGGAPNGLDGNGGLLIIQCPHYVANANHWNLGSAIFGTNSTPAINGGHGLVTGNPQQILVLTNSAPPAPPIFYSDSIVTSGICSNFSYQILTHNPAAWFGASGLPGGLSVSPTSGLITGRADTGGSFQVMLLASNQFGMSTQNLALSLVQSEQTIIFNPIEAQYICDSSAAISAHSSSGLPVTLTVISGPGIVTDATHVIWTNIGTVCLGATQSGNSCYKPAPSVTNCFTISPKPQTISFVAITNPYLCDPPLNLKASAGSGLPVSFAIVSGPASIIDNQLEYGGTGSVTVRASQAGNRCYAAATDVDRTFNVSRKPQIINFTTPSSVVQGKPFLLQATADSDLPVSISVMEGSAVVVGNLCVATNQGMLTIRATQAGSSCFLPNTNTQSCAANAYAPLSSLVGVGLSSIAFGAGRFVAVGFTNIYASSDGLTWTLVPHAPIVGDFPELQEVVFGGDTFVAVERHGQIHYSKNGLDWALGGQYLPNPTRHIYAGGKFVAFMHISAGDHYDGQSASSTDGITWTFGTRCKYYALCNSATFGNGKFLASGYNIGGRCGFWDSSDGLNWSFPGPNYYPADISADLCFAYGRFISVGWTNSVGKIKTSSDGKNWDTALNSGPILNRVSYAGGRLVAGGRSGRILASSDGINWVPQTGGDGSSEFLNSAYGNGMSIIVGHRSSGGTIFLVSYPEAPIPTILVAGGDSVGLVGSMFSYQILAGNNPSLYAAIGLPPGLMIDARNGLIFGTPTLAGNYSVTLAAANAGGISTNGVNFTIAPKTPWPTVLSQPQDQAVFVGANAAFAVTAIGDPPLSYQWLKDRINLSDGGHINGATSNILTLSNVNTNDAGIYSVLVSNTCGSATSSNAILTVSSAPPQFVAGSARVSSGQFRVMVQSEVGRSFQILVSTNLISWATHATLTNASGQVPFAEPTNSGSMRFYRVTYLPGP